jgi:hypothetical protein
VRPSTLAVAARNRSAVSLCVSKICRETNATSCVIGASRKGAVAFVTQSAVVSRRRILPLLARTSTSQVSLARARVRFECLSAHAQASRQFSSGR